MLTVSVDRMRNYRLLLFLSCTAFLVTWLPHLLSSLLRAPQPFSDLSLLCLSSGLLAAPIIYPGQVGLVPSSSPAWQSECVSQNNEVQQLIKKLWTLYCTRKPKVEENLELGIIDVEGGRRKEEEAVENNEWWVIIRLQVRINYNSHTNMS